MKAMAAVSASFLAVSVALAQSRSSAKPPVAAAPGYDPAIYAELQKAPEKARHRANPYENDPHAVAAGAILFEQHCAECHGKSAEGSPKAPSLVVREKLPEPQRWQLVRYIKSLGGPALRAESPAAQP